MIVCVTCGNAEIQVKRWVNPNTDQVMDEGNFNLHYVEDNWCVNCDEHVNLKDEEDD
jgi:hypothetical protein